MSKLTKISSGQTPTIRAAIKAGSHWFDKETDLATQAELNAEFSSAATIPFPISLTIYKSSNTLTPTEFKIEKASPIQNFVNMNVSTAAFIESATVEEAGLTYNFSHALDTRLNNPFTTSGVYWNVYKIYPKAGSPIVITAGLEVC